MGETFPESEFAKIKLAQEHCSGILQFRDNNSVFFRNEFPQ
jgi:hypothetical protein